MGSVSCCTAWSDLAVTDIDAPIEICWAILLDMSAWPEWNPFNLKCEAVNPGEELKAGVMLNNRIAQGEGTKDVLCWITEFEPPMRFEISGSEKCVPVCCAYGRHYWHLEKIGDRTTRLRHGEFLGGGLLWISKFLCCGPCQIDNCLGKQMHPRYEEFNRTFQKRVAEQRATYAERLSKGNGKTLSASATVSASDSRSATTAPVDVRLGGYQSESQSMAASASLRGY